MKKSIFIISNTCNECGGSGKVHEDDGCENDTEILVDCGGCGGSGIER